MCTGGIWIFWGCTCTTTKEELKNVAGLLEKGRCTTCKHGFGSHPPGVAAPARGRKRVYDAVDIQSMETVESSDDSNKFRKLHHIEDILGAGSKNDIPFYVRGEVDDLWTFLSANVFSIIYGTPGIGKSTATWAWLQTNYTRSAFWWDVECNHQSLLSGSKFQRVKVSGDDLEDDYMGTLDCLVFDGVTSRKWQKFYELAHHLHKGNLKCKIIMVTSSQVHPNRQGLDAAGVAEFFMKPWSKEEFSDAFANDFFYGSVKEFLDADLPDRNVQLDSKFYYAGHSARWMLYTSTERVIQDIEENLSKVTDKQILIQGLQGNRSELAVNHLVAMFGRAECVFTSEFVARRLALDCEYSFITQASYYSDTNPSFDGLILEMDVLHCIAKGIPNKFKLLSHDTLSESFDDSFKCDSCHRFNRVADIIVTDEMKKGHHWFIPLKFNQGGYDAVQLYTDNNIWNVRFIQVTMAKKHSLKVSYMSIFFNALKSFLIGREINVYIDIIAPLNKACEYERPSDGAVTGKLEWTSESVMKVWTKEDLRIFGFERASFRQS